MMTQWVPLEVAMGKRSWSAGVLQLKPTIDGCRHVRLRSTRAVAQVN